MTPELDPRHLGDHIDRLYRAALALCGRREDAEDLVQETFVRVLAKSRWINDDDDLGYLLRSLRNTFLTRKRDASRRPQTTAMDFEPEETRPIGRPEDSIQAMDLYAAITRLSDEHRDVLVAVDVTGLSYKEAAAALEVPEGTVMSRLYRARAALGKQLGP